MKWEKTHLVRLNDRYISGNRQIFIGIKEWMSVNVSMKMKVFLCDELCKNKFFENKSVVFEWEKAYPIHSDE